MSRFSGVPGEFNLVKWPNPATGYTDTGEGGMAAWLLVERSNSRRACSAGPGALWPTHDVVLYPRTGWNPEWDDEDNSPGFIGTDAAFLLGETGGSWFSEQLGDYFEVTPVSLTEQGAHLYDTVKALYGVTPTIVTLLDT